MAESLAVPKVAAAEAELLIMQLPREERGTIATRHDAALAAELRERIRAVEAGEMKLVTEEDADAEVEELLR